MSKNKAMMQDLLYMQALQPQNGCEVDFAVGTTFSLSMEGLMAVPLALSKLGESKKLNDKSSIYFLTGIYRAANKFVIFCNKTSIYVPTNCQPLYSLLEASVVEVGEKENPLANFHPKLWIIREVNQSGDCWIKVIITSRNLTFSTDLDVAIVIRGHVNKNTFNCKNKPLADMIRTLAQQYDKNSKRQQKINLLAADLESVETFDFEYPMSNKVYEIHPLMLKPSGPSKNLNSTLLKKRLFGKRVLIISPFINSHPEKGILKEINDNSEKLYLVTNDNNVTETLCEMLPGRIYVPNILLSESDNIQVNLHAKIYLVEQKNGALYMYLGSTNATNKGFTRNSEILIGMRINQKTFDEVFDELVTKDNLYIPATVATTDITETNKREIENEMEHILRWAVNSIRNASIIKKRYSEETPYEVTVHITPEDKIPYFIEQIKNEYKISIRPLQTLHQWRNFETDKLQWQLRIDELSEFYVVNIVDSNKPSSHKSCVCKVLTDGLDRFITSRNNHIVNSIVRTDNIMQYIDMILSDFPEYTFEEWEKRKKRQEKKIDASTPSELEGSNIYEKLLKASYESPERLKEIKEFVGKLSSNDISENLKNMLAAFGIRFTIKKQ